MRQPDSNVAFGQVSPADTAGIAAAKKAGYSGTGAYDRPVTGASDGGYGKMFQNPAYPGKSQNATSTKARAQGASKPRKSF